MPFKAIKVNARTAELRFEFAVSSGMVTVKLHSEELLNKPIEQIPQNPQASRLGVFGDVSRIRTDGGEALRFQISHEGSAVGEFKITEDGQFHNLGDSPLKAEALDTLRYTVARAEP